MKNRIKDKIEELGKFLLELEEIKPLKLEDYMKDLKTRAACERYVEKISQAFVDLAFLVIKEKRLKTPESDYEAFEILANNKVISSNLANNLSQAKGMRNILAHEYGEVDNEIVFNSIDEELTRDGESFIKSIKSINLF